MQRLREYIAMYKLCLRYILNSYTCIRLLPFSLNTFAFGNPDDLHSWLEERPLIQRTAIDRIYYNLALIAESSHGRQTMGLQSGWSFVSMPRIHEK